MSSGSGLQRGGPDRRAGGSSGSALLLTVEGNENVGIDARKESNCTSANRQLLIITFLLL